MSVKFIEVNNEYINVQTIVKVIPNFVWITNHEEDTIRDERVDYCILELVTGEKIETSATTENMLHKIEGYHKHMT